MGSSDPMLSWFTYSPSFSASVASPAVPLANLQPDYFMKILQERSRSLLAELFLFSLFADWVYLKAGS